MKIAMFVNNFLPVSETFVLRQIVGLLERGHSVDIFEAAPADPRDVNQEALRRGLMDRVRYLYSPRREPRNQFWRVVTGLGLLASLGWRYPKMFALTYDVMRLERTAPSLDLLYAAACLTTAGPGRYDIIHCQFGPLGLLALRLMRLGVISGKLVTAFRGYDATRYLKAHPEAYTQLFLEGDLFCPNCESLERLIVAAGCGVGKIAIHHSGVDCARLTYRQRRRDPHEPVKLLTVARLVQKKGVACAVHAVARLVRQGSQVSYVIAGEGVLRPDLERLVAELGLGAHVRMLGSVDEEQVARLLREAHILVAPSVTAEDGDQEGIPNVLKEAMATGLPVVSTHHSGIPELVEDGVSGFLVAEHDVDALTDRLTYLIDHSDRWSAMGAAGRLKVQSEFDIERLNDELVELYRQLLRDGGPVHVEDRKLAAVP